MALRSLEQQSYTGIPLPTDAFIIIVRTEWNADTVDILEEGCISVLKEYNMNYTVLIVPGAFEIGFAINNYWNYSSNAGKPAAFIALGCVCRGETPHFEYVCKAVTDNVSALNITLPVPIIFGVLTVNNQSEADDRTGGKQGHKGREAAITALKMISLSESFKK